MASSSYEHVRAKRRARLLGAALGACACWLLASCGHGRPGGNPASPALQSITVLPQSATVAAGLAQQYEARGNYSDGSSGPLSNATWATSNASLATVNLNGLVVAAKQGSVTVTATFGPIAGSAALTIGPTTDLLGAPRALMQEVPVASESPIPADFSASEAMRLLYGNFDSATQTSVSALPPRGDRNSFFKNSKGVEARPFWIAATQGSAGTKVVFGTYASPLGKGLACHACAPLIGLAVFAKTGGGWIVESSTKAAAFSGEWGEPSRASLVRIGPDRVGIELTVWSSHQGEFTTFVSLFVPWKGDVLEAFSDAIADGNTGNCGTEEDMLPCYAQHKDVSFVKGRNADYDDMVLTLTGTELSKQPPYKVVAVSGTERKMFSEGRYIPLH